MFHAIRIVVHFFARWVDLVEVSTECVRVRWVIFSSAVKAFCSCSGTGKYIFVAPKEEKDPRSHFKQLSVVPVFLFRILNHFLIDDYSM